MNGGPLPGTGSYPAYIACNLSSAEGVCSYTKTEEVGLGHPYLTQTGSDRESDGDQYLANLQNGAWVGYKYFALTGKESRIAVTVRGNGVGTLSVATSREGIPVAQIVLEPNEDWSEATASLSVPGGTAPLYFIWQGTGALDINSFTIE